MDANGNTDAAAVEDAKKTPAVWMDDEVAADVVPKVSMVVNGNAKVAPVFVMVH